MKRRHPSEPGVSRLILTHWSANVEGIGYDLETVANQLALLSLLYDEVYIQEEVLAQSLKLAGWYHSLGNEGAEFLDALFKMGSIRVLGMSEGGYQRANHPDLYGMSLNTPIKARSEYIQDASSKHGRPLRVTRELSRFIHDLDDRLGQDGEFFPAYRRVRDDTPVDFMASFPLLLKPMLESVELQGYMKQAFGPVSEKTRDLFLEFLYDPDKAVKYVSEKTGQEPRLPPDPQGNPMVTRSVLEQAIRQLERKDERKPMVRRVQSAFAAGFCAAHDALGYCRAGTLPEYPTDVSDPAVGVESLPEFWADRSERRLVGAWTHTFTLPVPLSPVDLFMVVAELRGRGGYGPADELLQLREVLWGPQPADPERARHAWEAVARRLRSTLRPYMGPYREFSITKVVVETLRGAIFSELLNLGADGPFQALSLISLVGPVCYHYLRWLRGRVALERKVFRAINAAVEFRVDTTSSVPEDRLVRRPPPP